MKIRDLISYLEEVAPPAYQESYDNAGLIVGDADAALKGVLICLDSTEAVIEEAVAKGCNLVVAHHPIIFRGLKRLTGRTYVERAVIKAIREDVAIYAIHTNLDNVYSDGVNAEIARRLGLVNTRLLAPKRELKKLSSFIPALHRDQVEEALIKAGADQVAFTHQTSYSTMAVLGNNGFEAEYLKLEALFTSGYRRAVMQALYDSQPDREVHFDVVAVENQSLAVGAGLIGQLEKPMSEQAFLYLLKDRMQAECVRHTRLLGRQVRQIAICGGAGSFLLSKAIDQGAEVFVSADFKYHEFFDAEDHLVIADIGHYESEQFTIKLLCDIISENFSNFAVYCTEINTNPVQYLL